ncbi:MAG: hypothetical protein B7Z66_01030 [Chromatiales bacterium 21-64-14]|nr:MAG: hypothetical protein B7Z66_01030 [Chromatiales bacterium 21-64-14]HQU16045.1 hypothetical protein [Gammaproteobacteria bacterium]
MTGPTVDDRLRRRFLVMTQDDELLTAFQAVVPAGWEMVLITDLEAVGDWNAVLLYRFLLLDLDEVDAFDPLDVIRELRLRHQINTPVFCFGGDEDVRDEMRLSRADRFFDRDEILAMLPRFLEQYRWGGDSA